MKLQTSVGRIAEIMSLSRQEGRRSRAHMKELALDKSMCRHSLNRPTAESGVQMLVDGVRSLGERSSVNKD